MLPTTSRSALRPFSPLIAIAPPLNFTRHIASVLSNSNVPVRFTPLSVSGPGCDHSQATMSPS